MPGSRSTIVPAFEGSAGLLQEEGVSRQSLVCTRCILQQVVYEIVRFTTINSTTTYYQGTYYLLHARYTRIRSRSTSPRTIDCKQKCCFPPRGRAECNSARSVYGKRCRRDISKGAIFTLLLSIIVRYYATTRITHPSLVEKKSGWL